MPGGIPQVIPTDPNVAQALATGKTTGKFFDANVYGRAGNDGQTRPDRDYLNKDGSSGQVKYLRVIEAIPMTRNRDDRKGSRDDVKVGS